MIKVDQDKLCDFCRDHYQESDSWHCEGTQCESITEVYLRDNGITEDDQSKKTFGSLTVGDDIYLLVSESIIPEIKKVKVNSISRLNDDQLRVQYNSTWFSVDNDKLDSTSLKGFFIYRKDCKNKLEGLCVERIIQLSKAIGQI